MVAFLVRDKRFASIGKDNAVQLHLPAAEADELLAAHPTAARLTRGPTPIGVRVPLEDINGQQLNHRVRRAWLSRAPKRLAAQAAAGDTAAAGEVGDPAQGHRRTGHAGAHQRRHHHAHPGRRTDRG
jgi:hypothetical protein